MGEGSDTAREHLEALLESTDDYILICDECGKPVAFNAAYAAVMQEALGIEMRAGLQPHTLLPDPAQVAWWDAQHRRVLGGERFRVEYELSLPASGTRHFELSYTPIRRGGRIAGFCEVARDITDRKRAEREVSEREERYRSLVESTSAVLWEVDLGSGRFTYVSPRVEEVLGYPVEAWTDFDSWVDRVHPEDRASVVYECRTHIERGLDHQLEFRLFAADGRVVWARDVVNVVVEGGRPTGLRGFLFDITAEKELEQELHRNRNLAALGPLAAGIAHDFNNLLSTLFGNIELARLQAEADAPLRELLARSLRAAGRAEHLTRQLLSFARGGAPRKETVAIGDLVRDSATFVLSGSPVGCTFDLSADLWPADVDPGQIDQVVHNLVRNARDAMEGGGVLRIAARNLPGRAEPTLPLAGRDRLEVTIEDTGDGIAPEHLAKIFDPYFTTKPPGGRRGTGLGLWVCRSVVEKHEGEVTVRSVPGEGTVFSLYLPASRRCRAGVPEGQAGVEPPPAGRTRLLVMEDEAGVREVLGGFLRRLGHHADFAGRGEEAVRLYRQALEAAVPYDAVLLDLTVRGGKGGTATLAELRAADPGVRAAVLSGYAADPAVADPERHGFRGALVKPFTLAALAAMLDRILAPDGAPPCG